MDCITKLINENFPDVECPHEDCGEIMPEWEIGAIVGKEKLEEL